MAAPQPHRRRRSRRARPGVAALATLARLAALATLVALGVAAAAPSAAGTPPSVARAAGMPPGVAPAALPRDATTPAGGVIEEVLRVPVRPEPDGSPVTLDVTIYRPGPGAGSGTAGGAAPAGGSPALVLAHGFGGSKADSAQRGPDYARAGYVVLAYSARGFGASGGRIHLDDPDYEVADARALVDVLAARPDVLSDAPADPRVGVVGASYGGALALMLGATDPRLDAVAAAITWHDLADAFFPQHAVSSATPLTPAEVTPAGGPGPFKQLWAARFFASAAAPDSRAADPVCGRFDPTVCRLFLAAAETGEPSPELLTLLRTHSPKPLLAGLRAPTMLVQGMRDSLFGLEHADATARAIAGRVPALSVRWIDGGHDGASSTVEADEQALQDFLRATLGRPAGVPVTAVPAGFVWASALPRRQTRAPLLRADGYAAAPALPATPGVTWICLPMTATGAQRLLTPPGGQPGAVTALPGAGTLLGGAAAYQLAALPGQSGVFDAAPLTERRDIVGAPRVRLRVTSSGPDVVLFVSLWQMTGEIPSLTRKLVAPVRVAVTPGRPTDVDVALPPATWTAEAGSTLRLLVTTTDAAYAPSRRARIDSVELAEPVLRVPTLAGTVVAADSDLDRESIGVALALGLAVVALAGAGAWQRRRRREVPARTDLADVPLAVEGLVKTYADGHRAVDEVSWRAERGQVVGLLGPNGAGKTTTLRMALGLIHPDAGATYLGGEPVRPGAPALRRVGALVEGPGFLPHLTGRENLLTYWAATGRDPALAHVEEALEVAALGDAVDRPVRSYSHGMKQRLGIAQAMLGRPELLVLDEPTNGLDPPQIAAMRPILRRYAAAGRTVVVSSHLLAEVEQTCSHVVVMHAGRVLMTGAVADLVDSRHHLEEVFLGVIAAARGDAATPEPGSGPAPQAADSEHPAAEVDALTERLRQVRAR